MAKIEVAYSLEIEEYVGAIEANELWIEGKLKDKKAFICAGKDCYAGITCKNMDTYASDRKMIPHFIMSQQDNMHSESCEIYREFLKIDINRNKTKNLECKEKAGKGICFHMTRPERHRIIEHILPTGQEINLKEREKQIRKKRRNIEERKANYYCLNSLVAVQVVGVADWKNKAEDRFDSIQRSIDTLNENFVSDKDFKNFVIYKGQKFEADAAYIDIYQQARKSIYVVDDYVNTKTLQLLSQKHAGVEVVLFTENGHGKRGFLTTTVVNDFIQEYPPLRIKPNVDCHDRLIVLDYGESTEQAYHCGASSKDAGKKLCAINVILKTSMIHPVIDKMLLSPDKQI